MGDAIYPYEGEISALLTIILIMMQKAGWTPEQQDAYMADQRAKFKANNPENLPDV